MKTIDTLIPDIQGILKNKGWLTNEIEPAFSAEVTNRLRSQFGPAAEEGRTTLRLSRLGPTCPCALWHSIHKPELAEALPPWAQFKYAFGHVIEGLAVALAKAAGHEVTGEQDELRLDGIVGHRDCIIDGCTVDVKSSSSISFGKFKAGDFMDTFGYLDQLDGYVLAAKDDPLVRVKNKGYLLVIDKQLGHICLYPHEVTDERERILRERIERYKGIVSASGPPPCGCKTVEEGQSGNIRLDLQASYSSYKHVCFPHLRTFLYSKGPVFMTKVVKRPFNKDGPILEIDKNGKVVYN